MTAPSDHYDVVLTNVDGESVVVVSGEIDLDAAGPLWDSIEQVIDTGQERLVIDLTDVTFIDSSGVNVLVRAQDALDGRADAVVLVSPSPTVVRTIAMAGLEGCFTVEP